jgi:hypothetical protein
MGTKKSSVRGRGMGSSGTGYGEVVGFCKYGNQHLSFIKYGKFLESLKI